MAPPFKNHTARAFLWTNFLKAPFWGMYALLLFILSKDLEATPFQITALIALKPIVSLFSPYWSVLVHQRSHRLRSNIILASLIGHAPFFFFPWVSSPWFVVGAGAFYLMMKRGVIPSWMELLKRDVPESKRHVTFSYGSIFSYLGGAILPIFFGKWMDMDSSAWRLLFPFTALLSLTGTFFLLQIPMEPAPEQKASFDLREVLIRPWKNAWNLFRKRPDFIRYQIGFMFGGAGLMVMQPAFPKFFLEELDLSYTTLAFAVATCKGVGFSLTSKLWAKWLGPLQIFRFSGVVTLLATLFPIALVLAKIQLTWIYIAYLIYGVMQAGSEMSWHLSGPLFARSEDSSTYSSVNVVTVGLRGLVAPVCGSILCAQFGSIFALLFGGLLCFIGALRLFLPKTDKTVEGEQEKAATFSLPLRKNPLVEGERE